MTSMTYDTLILTVNLSQDNFRRPANIVSMNTFYTYFSQMMQAVVDLIRSSLGEPLNPYPSDCVVSPAPNVIFYVDSRSRQDCDLQCILGTINEVDAMLKNNLHTFCFEVE